MLLRTGAGNLARTIGYLTLSDLSFSFLSRSLYIIVLFFILFSNVADPDPLVKVTDPDPAPDPDSSIRQK